MASASGLPSFEPLEPSAERGRHWLAARAPDHEGTEPAKEARRAAVPVDFEACAALFAGLKSRGHVAARPPEVALDGRPADRVAVVPLVPLPRPKRARSSPRPLP